MYLSRWTTKASPLAGLLPVWRKPPKPTAMPAVVSKLLSECLALGAGLVSRAICVMRVTLAARVVI